MEDGHQNVSHDRILMRVKDYLQIATTVGAVLWAGLKLVRSFDHLAAQVNQMEGNVTTLQKQVTYLQSTVLSPEEARRAMKNLR
jgi:predicted xylose isomerase-like sugar epimerase